MPRRAKGESRPVTATHLIDTNVIVRFLMGDDPPKAARATALMERVERAEETVELSDEVIVESVWTLDSFYQVPRSEIFQRMTGVLSFAGIRVNSKDVLLDALQRFANSNADFVDCLLAARCRRRNMRVYTFDETDFKKFNVDWDKP